MVLATSLQFPSRLSGIEFVTSRTTVLETFFTIFEAIIPGATAFTRIPRGASSAASDRVKLSKAPLEAL